LAKFFVGFNTRLSAVEPRPPLRQRRRANGGGSRLQRRSYFAVLVFPSTNRSDNFLQQNNSFIEGKFPYIHPVGQKIPKLSEYPIDVIEKLSAYPPKGGDRSKLSA
jgi:hypothetical protein